MLDGVSAFIEYIRNDLFYRIARTAVNTARVLEFGANLGYRVKSFVKHCVSDALCNKRDADRTLIACLTVDKSFKQIAIRAGYRDLASLICILRVFDVYKSALTLDRYIGIFRERTNDRRLCRNRR